MKLDRRIRLPLFITGLAIAGGIVGYVLRNSGQMEAQAGPVVHTKRSLHAETDWNDYLWPTDASNVRTSCFAEFRSTHFHAGIDISTNMRTGYDVFASRDGWLHSITFEPFGYGWYLVLQHDDGYFTAYAHLKGFPDSITSAYRKRLLEQGRSFGSAEWKKGEVRCKKGSVIAYTGATGAGPPHLHFEIRDRDFNPVNPGLSKNMRPVDTIPPLPRQVCFMPLDAMSSVNGKHEPLVADIIGNAKAWTLRSEPTLTGRVGILLRANDAAQGAQDYPTPYSIEMKVNDRPFFRSRFDWIQDHLGWHIRIDRDNALMLKRKGEFRKLYVEEGNELSVYEPDSSGSGELSSRTVGVGKKKITLRAADISGNSSIMTFNVNVQEDGVDEMDTSVKGVPAKFSVATALHYDEIVLTIKTSSEHTAQFEARLEQRGKSAQAKMKRISKTEWRGVVRPWDGFTGTATLRVKNGDAENEWTSEITGSLISSSSGGVIRSSDELFALRFKPHDVYRSMFVTLHENGNEANKQYVVSPQDVPLAGSPRVMIRRSGNDRKSVISALHSLNGVRLRAFARQSDEFTCTTSRYLATYSLKHDEEPPAVSVTLSKKSDQPVRIAVKDSLSGVVNESIKVWSGEKLLPVEYSESLKSFTIPVDVYRAMKKDTIVVSVSDHAGNEGRGTFRVK